MTADRLIAALKWWLEDPNEIVDYNAWVDEGIAMARAALDSQAPAEAHEISAVHPDQAREELWGLLMPMAIIRELTGTQHQDGYATVEAVRSALNPQPKGTAKCNCTAYCGQYLMHGSCPAYPAAVTVVPAPAPLTSVCHMECGGCIDAGKCAFPGKPAEPARYPHPDEDDAVTLWAEIHRLRAAVQGPDGYATWQEAATAERVRRVAAEKALAATRAPAPAPAIPAGWNITRDEDTGPGCIRVFSPIPGPGGTTLAPPGGSLAYRLLYALCNDLLAASTTQCAAVPHGKQQS